MMADFRKEVRNICLLCLKSIEKESIFPDEYYQRIFRSCRKHLSSKVIGDEFIWTAERSTSPFCQSCFEFSEKLCQIDEQLEKNLKTLRCLIASFSKTVITQRDLSYPPLQNIDTELEENDNFDGTKEPPDFHALNVLENEDDFHLSADEYNGDLTNETDVEMIKQEIISDISQDDISDPFTIDVDIDLVKHEILEVEGNTLTERMQTNITLPIVGNRHLRVQLEQLKCDLEGKVITTSPKKRRNARVVSNAAIINSNSINVGKDGESDGEFTNEEHYESDGNSDHYVQDDCESDSDSSTNGVKVRKLGNRKRVPRCSGGKKAKGFSCAECDKILKSAKELEDHCANFGHVTERTVQCPHCPQKYYREKDLVYFHLPSHRFNLTCDICDKSFKTYETFRIHKRKHEGRTYNCKICDKQYVKLREYRDHMNSHTGNKPYECGKCGLRFGNKSTYTTHKLSHETNRFVCSFCSKTFTSRKYLVYHERAHTGENPHKCQYCPSAYNTPIKLKRHFLAYHSYKCNQCESGLPSAAELTKHMQDAHNVQPSEETNKSSERSPEEFICDICGKSCINKIRLNYHRRYHRRDQCPMQCETCGNVYKKRSSLNRHIKVVHEKILAYTCDLCGKSYAGSFNLKVHMTTTHSGEKPFKCKLCGRPFSRKDNLQTHYRLMHQPRGKPPKKLKKTWEFNEADATQSNTNEKSQILSKNM